ncbi:MAG: hypothetical protein DHS80DRAFT_24637 [Piptocephalis tieghemiana]|nr:MAG: hypothetical protein DHS80DRAFT_24637 [Piptocephalis tieghemiana]
MLVAKLVPTLLFLLLPTSLYATENAEMGEASTQRPSAYSPLMEPFLYSCLVRSRVSPFGVLDLLLRYPSEIPKLFDDIQSRSHSTYTNLANNAQRLKQCFEYFAQEASNFPYYAAFIGNMKSREPKAVELETLGKSLQKLLKALLDQDPSSAVYKKDLENHVKRYWKKTFNTGLAKSLSWKWSKRVSELIHENQPEIPSLPSQTSLLRPQPINSCLAEFFFLNLSLRRSRGHQNMKMTCLNDQFGKALSLISSAKTFTLINTGQVSLPFTLLEIQGFLTGYINARDPRKYDISYCIKETSKCSQWYAKVKGFAEKMSMPFAFQEKDFLVLATALTRLDKSAGKAIDSINSYNFVPTCEEYKVEDHWRLISNAFRYLRLRIWEKDISRSEVDQSLLKEVKDLFSTLSEAVQEVSNDEIEKKTYLKNPNDDELYRVIKEHRRLTAGVYSQMASLATTNPFSPDIMSGSVLMGDFTRANPIIMDEGKGVEEVSLDKSLLLLTGSELSPTDVGSRKISGYRSFFKHLARIAYGVRFSDGTRYGDRLITSKLPQLNKGILDKRPEVQSLYNRVDFALRWIFHPLMSNMVRDVLTGKRDPCDDGLVPDIRGSETCILSTLEIPQLLNSSKVRS